MVDRKKAGAERKASAIWGCYGCCIRRRGVCVQTSVMRMPIQCLGNSRVEIWNPSDNKKDCKSIIKIKMVLKSKF